jgi:hypothetical protein
MYFEYIVIPRYSFLATNLGEILDMLFPASENGKILSEKCPILIL